MKSSLNQGSEKPPLIYGLQCKAVGRDVEQAERGRAVRKKGHVPRKTPAPVRFAARGILGRPPEF